MAVARPDERLTDLLPRVTRESGGRALVFEQGRLVGMVTPVDVARVLETRALITPTNR